MRFLYQLRQAHRQWKEDDGNLLAAAVAYYSALSFFPLLLVLISAMGLLLQSTAWGHDAERQVLLAISEYASPAVASNVHEMLNQVQRKAVVGGPLGVGLLTFTAAALFAQFDRAFDRIWNVNRRPVEGLLQAVRRIVLFRLRAFLMLVALLVLTLVVLIAGVTISTLKANTIGILPVDEWAWRIVESGFSVLLNSGLFTLMYRVLPKVYVRWSDAVRGGLLAAMFWEVGRLTLNWLLISHKYSAYGVVGSFIALMLWVYFAATVVFIGAEYVQVISGAGHARTSTGDTAKRRFAMRGSP